MKKHQNESVTRSRLNMLTTVCMVEKRFEPGSEVCFEVGALTGMIGIGLIDLKKAKDANFINCIKDGVFMDSFGRLIPTHLE